MSDLTNFKGTGKAGLPDIQTLIKMGIDPKTGMPLKMTESADYGAYKRLLRIIDEQDAINRFEWENLPLTINGRELERLLYYRGQLVFFKWEGKYYLMPYALDGTIDYYGRYNTVHPVPMTSGQEKEEESTEYKNKLALLSMIKLDICHNLNEIENFDLSTAEVKDTLNKGIGVILKDYSNQLPQCIVPRYSINDCLCGLEADALCFLSTAMFMGSGLTGVRVSDADSYKNVVNGAAGLRKYARNGIAWIPIIGTVDFQELAGNSRVAIQDYFLAMQSLDNFRLSTYGLDNSGVFEKGSHILEEENNINQQKYHFVLRDSKDEREKFVEIVNKIFSLNVSVKVMEMPEVEPIKMDSKKENKEEAIIENMKGEDNGSSDIG